MSFNKDKNEALELFYAAIQSIDNRQQAAAFFDDLMTSNELSSISQRLQVTKMLMAGNTYQQIEDQTGVSTAIISRVKRFLTSGTGGVQAILEKLEENEKQIVKMGVASYSLLNTKRGESTVTRTG